jgi:hypothetical protein
MLKRDVQATEAARFEDPRSYIAKDGREVLYGLDWKERKHQLWVRCYGVCEYGRVRSVKNSAITLRVGCTREAQDPHHLIRRSESRDDRLANLQALCRFHHDLLDERKPRWSSKS